MHKYLNMCPFFPSLSLSSQKASKSRLGLRICVWFSCVCVGKCGAAQRNSIFHIFYAANAATAATTTIADATAPTSRCLVFSFLLLRSLIWLFCCFRTKFLKIARQPKAQQKPANSTDKKINNKAENTKKLRC